MNKLRYSQQGSIKFLKGLKLTDPFIFFPVKILHNYEFGRVKYVSKLKTKNKLNKLQ